jgi:thymidylate synthase (FAD)
MVEVQCIEFTDNPEELVCTCARNDYYNGNVTEDSLETVMEGTDGDTIQEKKYTLLKKLMLRGHWGPFEHPQFTLHFRVSRSCMAQITRHRHISFDIQSMRYVDFSDKDGASREDFRWPDAFVEDSVQAREGGLMNIDMSQEQREAAIKAHYEACVLLYEDLVESGVPKEKARMVLPIGTKVNITASMNVRTAFHILHMRGAGDAQSEIRDLSQGIERVLEENMPTVMDVWNENQQAIQRQRLNP